MYSSNSNSKSQCQTASSTYPVHVCTDLRRTLSSRAAELPRRQKKLMNFGRGSGESAPCAIEVFGLLTESPSKRRAEVPRSNVQACVVWL